MIKNMKVDFMIILIMNFLYNPTGILYNDLESAYSAKTYKLQIKKEKGIIIIHEIIG